MKRYHFILKLVVAIGSYGLSRPSLFFVNGLPQPLNYLAPFLELFSLSLFISLILNCANWKQRILSSFTYVFSCQSIVYYAGILFTIQRLLPAKPLYQHLINIFLIGYNHFHLIIWGTLLIPWAFQKISRWLLISLVIVVWEYWLPTILIIPTGQTWIEFAPHLGLASIFGFPIYGMLQYALAGTVHTRNGFKIVCVTLTIFILCNLNFNPGVETSKKIAFTHMDLEPRGVLAQQKDGEFMRRAYLNELKKGMPQNWEADLWFAPESSWPILIKTAQEEEDVKNFIFSGTTPQTVTAMGITRLIKRTDYLHVKNSFLFFDMEGGKSYYDKIKLMPFSETNFLGFKDEFIADILGKKDFNIAGDSYPIFKTRSGVNFISTICSEVSHLGIIREYLNQVAEQPFFIMNGANDKWFTPSNIPQLHFIMNRWMAASFEMPVARATIGGISGFINFDGTVSTSLQSTQTQLIISSLRVKQNTPSGKNIYTRFGLWPICLLILSLVTFLLIKERRND